MKQNRLYSLLMVAPASAMVGGFFLYPLLVSLQSAITDSTGQWSLVHIYNAWQLYDRDFAYSLVVVAVSTVLIALLTLAISGVLTLSPFRRLNQGLAFLYRWPLFIPFIVAAQMMRTFLAKNGLMNNTLVSLHLLTPFETVSFLDWRGIIVTFVWKQLAFSTLLVAGAMAAVDSQQIKAAQNLAASRWQIFWTILLPQVLPNLGVALVLCCVTMMSVLSVPLMIGTGTPNMLTTDMAFRINSYGDYGTANALGVLSYLVTAAVAWFYLHHSMKQ
ncbi:ABC transporter permease [Celerinatantimonas yamalensis]|uniref:Sugar ABC transporter permease n=1 Tax=Celerinatantimonas yamalensis TaxID=559956 RepID=A0ABW9G2G0_9GAMM